MTTRERKRLAISLRNIERHLARPPGYRAWHMPRSWSRKAALSTLRRLRTDLRVPS